MKTEYKAGVFGFSAYGVFVLLGMPLYGIPFAFVGLFLGSIFIAKGFLTSA